MHYIAHPLEASVLLFLCLLYVLQFGNKQRTQKVPLDWKHEFARIPAATHQHGSR